jgi:hypothetical protein
MKIRSGFTFQRRILMIFLNCTIPSPLDIQLKSSRYFRGNPKKIWHNAVNSKLPDSEVALASWYFGISFAALCHFSRNLKVLFQIFRGFPYKFASERGPGRSSGIFALKYSIMLCLIWQRTRSSISIWNPAIYPYLVFLTLILVESFVSKNILLMLSNTQLSNNKTG